MTSRESIIADIRRIAETNGGRAPGWELFRSETRLSEYAWKGRYCAKWTDAVVEAGFPANTFHSAYSDEQLFLSFAEVARRLGRLPTEAEYKLAEREDSNLPGVKALKRLGTKVDFVRKLTAFANSRPEFEDIAQFCSSFKTRSSPPKDQTAVPQRAEDGFVYLIKSGRHYKIGRSNAAGRREREIALQLPEATRTVHVVRTDDPVGIEAYWHSRFAEKRLNGEWFELGPADVAAFRRRKFM